MSRPDRSHGVHEEGDTSRDWSRAAHRLIVDRTTAVVVTALRREGVQPLLLKGPATARWLYADDPSRRSYSDVDLMVAPERFTDAEAVLAGLGFTSRHTVRLRGERVPHARPFERPGAAPVDLHRSLHDLEDVPAERVWSAISRHSERLDVAGVAVDTPGVVARTLHTVFHVSLEDDADAMPVEDLRRAVAQVDVDVWRRAADLARELGAEEVMAAKLPLVPGGTTLAEAIGLTRRPLPARLLTTREEHSPPYVHSLARLSELRGVRARVRYLWVKAFPPASFLRQWTPIARWSVVGLAIAYVLRVCWTLASVPVAPLLWWWARRRARAAAAARTSATQEP